MKPQRVLVFIVLLLLLSCKKSGPPDIKIKWPEALLEGTDAAVFMVILNDGNGEDRLKGCTVKGIPEVICELHGIVDGRMRMIRDIEIPSKGTVELKPGDRHLMLIGAKDRLGEIVTIVLDFERSGPVEIKARVAR